MNFQARMESTLKAAGGQLSPADFVAALARRAGPGRPDWARFAETLAAVEDFQRFCGMMRQRAAEA